MRRKIIILPIMIFVLIMALCSCSKAPPSATLLIYMCGSDLESKTGIASENIKELLDSNIPDNVNVVIQTGGSNNWQSNNIPNDKIMRYVVKEHKLQELARLDDANMDMSLMELCVRKVYDTLNEYSNFNVSNICLNLKTKSDIPAGSGLSSSSAVSNSAVYATFLTLLDEENN